MLGAHRVEYGKDDESLPKEERDQLPEGYVMRNGQLMGSPLMLPPVNKVAQPPVWINKPPVNKVSQGFVPKLET